VASKSLCMHGECINIQCGRCKTLAIVAAEDCLLGTRTFSRYFYHFRVASYGIFNSFFEFLGKLLTPAA
jgi:hypothetical protein